MADGYTGTEPDPKMSSGWILEKLWKKAPGDGGLATSVRIHIAEILGKEAAKGVFLKFRSLELPNICTFLLENMTVMEELRRNSCCYYKQCFVHGDLHGDNIMIDLKDNIFLIDFGKTGLGHDLEDVTWLEAFLLFSYPDIEDDEDLDEALSFVPALAPSDGLLASSCEEEVMDCTKGRKCLRPRLAAVWSVVKSLRIQLAESMTSLASKSDGTRSRGMRQAGMVATLLSLRNALFFMGARENKKCPHRRLLALAMACAYARTAVTMCQSEAVRSARSTRITQKGLLGVMSRTAPLYSLRE